MIYASETSVSPERSRSEIEYLLRRYKADGFAYMWEGQRAIVGFKMEGRQIRFIVSMPDPKSPEIASTRTGKIRNQNQVQEAMNQATRQRWRALLLVIKAKLEAVESGVAEFQTEFMPYVVLPNGRTVAENLGPRIAEYYATGKMTNLLAAPVDA